MGFVIVILILILLYMFRGPILEWLENPQAPSLMYQEYPEGVDFTVKKDMDLVVSQDTISYTLKSACPKDYVMGDFYLQDVKDVDTNPTPNTGTPDISSRTQEIMIWQEDNFVGSKNFAATYTIRTRFYKWEFDEESSGDIADIPAGLKNQYNHDEWKIDNDRDDFLDNDEDIDRDGEWDYKIEPSNPQIRNLARNLAGGESNVYLVVKSFYDYLTKEILDYVPAAQGLPKDCITTLKDKFGDCDDYSILLISLCRSVNIPAWLELGVLYDRQREQWGGHGWAKVAIPFDGGITYVTIDIVNKQFLFHDPYRFIEWIDTGGDVTVTENGETKQYNNLDYYYHSFSYRSYGSPSISSPDTNNFETLSLSEFGEKQRIPVEGEGPGGGLCLTPGFEAGFMLIGVGMVSIFMVMSAKTLRPRKGQR
jgi:hypothetical protein